MERVDLDGKVVNIREIIERNREFDREREKASKSEGRGVAPLHPV